MNRTVFEFVAELQPVVAAALDSGPVCAVPPLNVVDVNVPPPDTFSASFTQASLGSASSAIEKPVPVLLT